MNRAVFLDRDGVINKRAPGDPDKPESWYVLSWDEFEFIHEAIEGLKLLAETDYELIVVSNQSCIGRGFCSHDNIRQIFYRMYQEIWNLTRKSTEVVLDGYYFCPHAPDAGCACRKPKPGMIYKAAIEHEIDLSRSWMVGDSITDMQAGQAAGIDHNIKILQSEAELLDCYGVRLDYLKPVGRGSYQSANHHYYYCPDLLEAAKLIVSRET